MENSSRLPSKAPWRSAWVPTCLVALLPVLALLPLGACGGLTNSSTTSAPAITSFQPTALTVGNYVVLTGSGFTNTSAVTIGGAPVASFAASGDTQLTVLVPTAAITGPIVVTTPSGSVSAGTFIVIPQITGFTPASGPVATQVTISGSGFTGATSVTFGTETSSLNAPVVVSPNEIIATVDAYGSTGTIQVLASGVTATSADPFTVTAQ